MLTKVPCPKKNSWKQNILTSGRKTPPYTLVSDFYTHFMSRRVSFSSLLFVCIQAILFKFIFGCSPLIRAHFFASFKKMNDCCVP
ncbi:hypothetical protein CW304_02190 [Bacillus sp. UFRGS-B20]|nr:hypothetical protein CW304_02190 [Bacillus sp. UFRGS-B20]